MAGRWARPLSIWRWATCSAPKLSQGSEIGTRVADVMARGELVPDALIIELMGPRILAAAARTGYLLDGFPRSTGQAEELLRLGAPPDLVIALDVSDAVLIDRILHRAQTENRTDDTAEVIAKRLQVFASSTRPVLDFFRHRGLLRDACIAPGIRVLSAFHARMSNAGGS